MNVVGYIRVSTEREEQESSIDTQIQKFRDWARDNNHTIVNIGVHHTKEGGLIRSTDGLFIDEGFSAYKEDSKRKAFEEMLSNARKGYFDIIYTKNIPRFSRKNRVFVNTLYELDKLGVEVIFQEEGKSSKKLDVSLSIMAIFAEEESKAKSRAVKSGIKKRQSEGIITTTLSYGYKRGIKKGEVLIVPEQAEVVKMIFDLYLQGEGGNKIARRLNKEGIKTQKGSVWHERNILNVLQNEIYIGWYVSFDKIKNRVRKETQRVFIPDLQIIPKDIFDKVREERIYRGQLKNKGIKPSSEHLLSNLLFCDNCRNTMKRKDHSYYKKDGTKKNWVEWVCSQNDRNGIFKCAYRNSLREEYLEYLVKEEIIKTRENNYTNLQNIFEGYKQARYNILGVKAKIPELETQLKVAEEAMVNFAMSATKTSHGDAYEIMIKALTDRFNHLNAEYKRCIHIEEELATKEKQYKSFINLVKTVDVDNLSNEVLKKLFYRIYVGTDELINEEFTMIDSTVEVFEENEVGVLEKTEETNEGTQWKAKEKKVRFVWNLMEDHLDMEELRQEILLDKRNRGVRIEKTNI